MGKLLKWSVWCPEHNATVYTPGFLDESLGEPTVCPLNENHTNISQQTIVGIRDAYLEVKEIDTEDLDPAFSRSKSVGVNFDVDAGQWGKKPVSFPYIVNVLNGEGYGAFIEDGDKAEFSIAPTLIGVAAQAAAQDATEIVVDSGIADLFAAKQVFPGMWFQYERGGNPSAPNGSTSTNPGDDENEIESFDAQTNTVKLRSGIQAALSPGDLIYLVVKYGEEIELQPNEEVDIGGHASGSASLPANTIFNIWYKNSGASSKRVRLRLNTKYGPVKE